MCMAAPVTKKPDPQLPASGLPSHFTILRLVCRVFEVETPEMERMLQLVRSREQKPDMHFPKKLNRVMLGDVERGESKWSLGVTTIAERALYSRILRLDEEKPTFSRTGIVAQEVVFHCLDLCKEFIPKLETKGVPADADLWILIEDVFIPTVFAHLMLKWQRGLGHEFLPIGPWYLPVFESGQYNSPVMRVLRSWMRAAGFRYPEDIGKALGDDDMRRKVNGWLNGEHVPTSVEAHWLIEEFAKEVSWLDSANDWKDRITLAIAMTNLCKWLDVHLQSVVPQPSLKLQSLLVKVNDDRIPVDERRYLAEPENFFAARLLKHRLVREDRWDTEITDPVNAAIGMKVPENPTDEELANFRRDLYWRVESGNWLLALIEKQNVAQNSDRKQKLAEPISWQETLMNIAVEELNLKLKTKRAGEQNAHRP